MDCTFGQQLEIPSQVRIFFNPHSHSLKSSINSTFLLNTGWAQDKFKCCFSDKYGRLTPWVFVHFILLIGTVMMAYCVPADFSIIEIWFAIVSILGAWCNSTVFVCYYTALTALFPYVVVFDVMFYCLITLQHQHQTGTRNNDPKSMDPQCLLHFLVFLWVSSSIP